MYSSETKRVSVSLGESPLGLGIGAKPLITDRAMANRIAKRLFEIYDRDHNGTIDEHEVSDLISDAYKTINKTVKVDRDDIKSMAEVLDSDQDGRASQSDMERLVNRYLCGN